MRIARFSLLFIPALALAAGCLPLSSAGGLAFDGAGGTTGDDTGFGGANDATAKTTPSASTGGQGGTDSGKRAPFSYSYLCGGSNAMCVPGPVSEECAPGGSPSMNNLAPDGGSKLTCQLVANDQDALEAKCTMAGDAEAGDPCKEATDCGVGLGCQGTPVTGVCRQYCCDDPNACPAQTYCTPSAMAELDIEVPFCAPVTPCELLNDAAWCGPGETCAVVRSDGTTSCVPVPPPGEAGFEGDACPCAAGYMCSNATGTCLKLCHVGGDECGTGICHGGTNPYPSGIGFCIPL